MIGRFNRRFSMQSVLRASAGVAFLIGYLNSSRAMASRSEEVELSFGIFRGTIADVLERAERDLLKEAGRFCRGLENIAAIEDFSFHSDLINGIQIDFLGKPGGRTSEGPTFLSSNGTSTRINATVHCKQ